DPSAALGMTTARSTIKIPWASVFSRRTIISNVSFRISHSSETFIRGQGTVHPWAALNNPLAGCGKIETGYLIF
uniref:hypothetical protein n=1 Tax=Dialister sp. TaxID=1955814 RepID=UPI004025D0A5